MPVGRDTHRDGTPRVNRNIAGHWSGTSKTPSTFVPYGDVFGYLTPDGTPTGPRGDEHLREQAAEADNPEEYRRLLEEGGPHFSSWDPASQTENPRALEQEAEYYDEMDDLGDLVDPQNDTYEEEGTHGQTGENIGRVLGTLAGKRVGFGKAGGEAGAKLVGAAEEKIKDPEFRQDVSDTVGRAAEVTKEMSSNLAESIGRGADAARSALGVAKDKLRR